MSQVPPLPSETPPPFGPAIDLPPPQGRGCGTWGWLLGGCLTVFLLLIIACAGLGWYGYGQLPNMAASVARQAVDQLDIPAEDKRLIHEQIDRVTNEYKEGRITIEQVGSIFENLAESPLFSLMMAQGSLEKYVKPSGLSEEEKAAAERTLERTARGVFEKKIRWEDLESALDHISDRGENGNRQFRDQVSDEDLRKFLQACKDLADQHEVPDEPFQVDFAAEVKRAVDEALERP